MSSVIGRQMRVGFAIFDVQAPSIRSPVVVDLADAVEAEDGGLYDGVAEVSETTHLPSATNPVEYRHALGNKTGGMPPAKTVLSWSSHVRETKVVTVSANVNHGRKSYFDEQVGGT